MDDVRLFELWPHLRLYLLDAIHRSYDSPEFARQRLKPDDVLVNDDRDLAAVRRDAAVIIPFSR